MCTPSIQELTMENYVVNCPEASCNDRFVNRGHLYMHLIKTHNLSDQELMRNHNFNSDKNINAYYCPATTPCPYKADSKTGKSFKNLKYLRQHYRKVHMAKEELCEACGKKFQNEMELRSHKEKLLCGKIYECKECDKKYNSLEALQTHGKRKQHFIGHPGQRSRSQKKRRKVDKASETNLSPILVFMDAETQTEEEPVEKCVAGVQTELSTLSLTTTSELQEDFQSLLRDMETQTDTLQKWGESPHDPHPDVFFGHVFQEDCGAGAATANTAISSSHMHTQTCTDFLSELADIQTQTNWSTDTATNFNYDDLLVSTETQTSFTQCLLESVGVAGDDPSGVAVTSTPSSSTSPYDCMYATQYTQTCDFLLETFLDAIPTDLITTYTQT